MHVSTINMIAAIGPNGEIGSANSLPWEYIKDDMHFFKKMTLNSTVIMGRKTYQSIGGPLPNRENIVISNSLKESSNKIKVFSSIFDAIISAKNSQIFIIGGATLYKQCLPFVENLYLTKIPKHMLVKESDTFFPLSFLPTPSQVINFNLTESIQVSHMHFSKNNDVTYILMLNDILKNGYKSNDRTNTGTISKFGLSSTYDLQHSFPLLTTKRVFWKGVVEELFWFLSGDTNANTLKNKGVNIWNAWADENGELGPVYGKQWRDFAGVDQIKNLLISLAENPQSRRHIVSAWNPAELSQMALPPCHMMFQFNVRENKYLDCAWYQRSADMFLGVPFNIASYALLTYIIAHISGYTPGRLTHFIGNAHIYSNHINQVKEQISRVPKTPPTLTFSQDFTQEDLLNNLNKIKNSIELNDYNPCPTIKAEIAV